MCGVFFLQFGSDKNSLQRLPTSCCWSKQIATQKVATQQQQQLQLQRQQRQPSKRHSFAQQQKAVAKERTALIQIYNHYKRQLTRALSLSLSLVQSRLFSFYMFIYVCSLYVCVYVRSCSDRLIKSYYPQTPRPLSIVAWSRRAPTQTPVRERVRREPSIGMRPAVAVFVDCAVAALC